MKRTKYITGMKNLNMKVRNRNVYEKFIEQIEYKDSAR